MDFIALCTNIILFHQQELLANYRGQVLLLFFVNTRPCHAVVNWRYLKKYQLSSTNSCENPK